MLNIPFIHPFFREREREAIEWRAVMEGEGSKNEDKNGVILEGGNGVELVREMVEMIQKVGTYTDFRKTQGKECVNLVRRLKLLTPLLEEIRELHTSISGEAFDHLLDLNKALLASKKLLKTCNSGSKIFLVKTPPSLLSLTLPRSLFSDFDLCCFLGPGERGGDEQISSSIRQD